MPSSIIINRSKIEYVSMECSVQLNVFEESELAYRRRFVYFLSEKVLSSINFSFSDLTKISGSSLSTKQTHSVRPFEDCCTPHNKSEWIHKSSENAWSRTKNSCNTSTLTTLINFPTEYGCATTWIICPANYKHCIQRQLDVLDTFFMWIYLP